MYMLHVILRNGDALSPKWLLISAWIVKVTRHHGRRGHHIYNLVLQIGGFRELQVDKYTNKSIGLRSFM